MDWFNKKYFSDIQNKVNETIDEEDSVENKYSKKNKTNSDE